MLMVHGLDKAIRQWSAETGNKKRYTALRNDVAVAFMDRCAEESGAVSPRLSASFKRRLYKKQKEWVFDVRNADSIEAGTTVPDAKRLGTVPMMNRALQRTTKGLPEMGKHFFRTIGKAVGLDVSE